MIDSFPLRITDADGGEPRGEEGSEGTPSMDTISDQQLPTEHDVGILTTKARARVKANMKVIARARARTSE